LNYARTEKCPHYSAI